MRVAEKCGCRSTKILDPNDTPDPMTRELGHQPCLASTGNDCASSALGCRSKTAGATKTVLPLWPVEEIPEQKCARRCSPPANLGLTPYPSGTNWQLSHAAVASQSNIGSWTAHPREGADFHGLKHVCPFWAKKYSVQDLGQQPFLANTTNVLKTVRNRHPRVARQNPSGCSQTPTGTRTGTRISSTSLAVSHSATVVKEYLCSVRISFDCPVREREYIRSMRFSSEALKERDQPSRNNLRFCSGGERVPAISDSPVSL